jgi:hypothetical protein
MCFLYGIGSFIFYFYVGVFKYLGDFSDFLPEVYKCAAFYLVFFMAVLVCCVTFV